MIKGEHHDRNQKNQHHLKDDSTPTFLLTERQRCWHEDVIGFCPGPLRDEKPYHHDYRYMTPGVLLYSNFEPYSWELQKSAYSFLKKNPVDATGM